MLIMVPEISVTADMSLTVDTDITSRFQVAINEQGVVEISSRKLGPGFDFSNRVIDGPRGHQSDHVRVPTAGRGGSGIVVLMIDSL